MRYSKIIIIFVVLLTLLMNPNIFKASPVVQTQLTLMSSVDSRLYAGQPYYMKRTVIEIGKKHGSLTLIGEGKLKNGRRSALCLCDLCGKISERDLSTFLTVMPKRCKCKNKTKEQCQHEWYVRKKSKKQISIIEDLPNEIWKDVIGYEGKYVVSNMGRVKGLKRLSIKNGKIYEVSEKLLYIGGQIYNQVALCKDAVQKYRLVHRLVLESFIKNTENKKEVNHINGIKTDNRVENLEWCTHEENVIHAINTGLMNIKGGNHSLSKKIGMCDMEGNIIEQFDYIGAAVLKYGFKTPQLITNAAMGRRNFAYGYKWKYI